MKLNRKVLRKLIVEEMQKLNEMQTGLGLPHEYDYDTLYRFVLNFIRNNQPISFGTPEYEKAEQLLNMLNNAVRDSVVHAQPYSPAGTFGYVPGTDPADTAHMKDVQGRLKMVRRALKDVMGVSTDRADAYRRGRSEDFRSAAKKLEDVPEHEKPWWARKK